MNIKAIKEIVSNPLLPNDIMERLVIQELAKDENVIDNIMKIISEERKNKKQLLDDCNLLLSKAHIGLEDKRINKDGFIQKEITEFYKKNKGKIGHCFKNLNEE